MNQRAPAPTSGIIPTVPECLDLMANHRMLANIREHSIMVAKVAEVLSRALIEQGHPLSLDTVVAGALLHDIGKTSCLTTGEDHARKGWEICRAHGHEELGSIVAEHVVLAAASRHNVFSEKVLVYYADKRVNHDRIVPLSERLAYILTHYGKNDPTIHSAIMKNYQHCQTIEEKLFQNLHFTPSDLKDLVNDSLAPLVSKHS